MSSSFYGWQHHVLAGSVLSKLNNKYLFMLVPLPKNILILFLLGTLFILSRPLQKFPLLQSSLWPSYVFFSSILCSDLGRANCYGFWAPLSMESLVRALGINSLSISAYFSPHPSYASLHEGCGFPSQPLLCVKERSSQTWVKLKGHPWEMTRVMQMLEMTVICLLASLPVLVLHQRHPDAFPECGEVLRWGLKSHSLCFGFELADAAEITSILIPPPFPVCLPIVSRSLDSICPLGFWMTFLWPF